MKQVLIFLLILLLYNPADAYTNRDASKKKEDAAKEDAANSSFSYDDSLKVLTINFIEAEMEKDQPEVVDYMRCNSCYEFDAEFILPDDLWKALGASEPLVIKKGSYPVAYKEGVYSITIQF